MLESILRSDLTSQMLDVLTGIPLGETAFFAVHDFLVRGQNVYEDEKDFRGGEGHVAVLKILFLQV